MNDQAESWESPLIQLDDLLKQHSIGAVATAIEKKGILGWDRFGRLTTFQPDSEEANKALNFLADQYKWEINYRNIQADEQSPLDRWDPEEGGPPAWGWKRTDFPDFKAISNDLVSNGSFKNTKNSRGINPKGQNYNLRVIGALVGFIKGNISPSGHPDYEPLKGFKGIADLISNKFGIGGEESLARRLSEGEKALQEAMVD